MLAEAMEEMEEIVQSFRAKFEEDSLGTPVRKVKRSSKGRNRNKHRQVTREEWTYFQERKCKINIIKYCKDERIKPENVTALGNDEVPSEFSGSRNSPVLGSGARLLSVDE